MLVCAVLDALGAIGRLMWQRWAFYVILTSSVIMCAISIYLEMSIIASFEPFFTPALTYVILRFLGKPNGWSQLE